MGRMGGDGLEIYKGNEHGNRFDDDCKDDSRRISGGWSILVWKKFCILQKYHLAEYCL